MNEGGSMIEIGVFHNGASDLPVKITSAVGAAARAGARA